MTIGETLKEIRKSKNMSIVELSNKSGLTKVAINNYEKGVSIPRAISLAKLCRALGCDYDKLYELIK